MDFVFLSTIDHPSARYVVAHKLNQTLDHHFVKYIASKLQKIADSVLSNDIPVLYLAHQYWLPGELEFLDTELMNVVAENGVEILSEFYPQYREEFIEYKQWIERSRPVNFGITKFEELGIYCTPEVESRTLGLSRASDATLQEAYQAVIAVIAIDEGYPVERLKVK